MNWKEDAQDLIDELSVVKDEIEADIADLERAIINSDEQAYQRINEPYKED